MNRFRPGDSQDHMDDGPENAGQSAGFVTHDHREDPVEEKGKKPPCSDIDINKGKWQILW